MEQVNYEKPVISYCGLYCENCSKFKQAKCPGCEKNTKASWCKIRSCCMEHGYFSCAECKEFDNVMKCNTYNNFISKIFGIIFRTQRHKGIEMIKEKGYKEFVQFMKDNNLVSIKK